MRSRTDIPDIVRDLLDGRGIPAAELERFFNPALTQLAQPEELPGIVEAAEVILSSSGKTVVFGDYDCDGVCATAIVVSCLKALAGGDPEERIVPFIPERLTEGYGMTEKSVSRMLGEYPDVRLLITVDNGINAVDEVANLKARGVRVVITDHHLPGEELPAADAIVDPKVAAPEHLNILCGAGVAFLLANRLVQEARRKGLYDGPSVAGPLLVLAGLATVTDIMPLVGQNRILVAEALRRFRTLAPIGLRELLDRAAKTGILQLTSKDFGFLLGPRINASGRLASGMEALELVLTQDREIARESARIIDARNTERKNIEQKMSEEAMTKIVPGAYAQVIDLPNGHPGVAGIVAARLMEHLGGKGPVCVLAGGHGSARSPDFLNIRTAFGACRELLTLYGGHAAAGGFAVKPGQVDAFRERLNAYCAQQLAGRDEGVKGPVAEAWIEASDVTVELGEWVARMEPFGEANPEPIFGIRAAMLTDVRPLGQDGRHLQATLCGAPPAPSRGTRHPGTHVRAVWWNHGEDVERIRRASAGGCDVLFTIEVSDYGEHHVEIRFVDIVPAAKE